jgi:hypothetical protein
MSYEFKKFCFVAFDVSVNAGKNPESTGEWIGFF